MKKNLISIIILALLVVNVVLTAIMMFSVTGASRKTAALVDNISTALNLELTAKTENGENSLRSRIVRHRNILSPSGMFDHCRIKCCGFYKIIKNRKCSGTAQFVVICETGAVDRNIVVGDGMLVSMGVSQLNELDDYTNSMGKTADGDNDDPDSIDKMTEALSLGARKDFSFSSITLGFSPACIERSPSIIISFALISVELFYEERNYADCRWYRS